MRIKNMARNTLVTIIGQVLLMVMSFVFRKVFIMSLGDQMNGLNGLFTDIISVLSLVELGVGSAIIYSLYRPLANENIDEIKSIMNFFKRVYFAIGILVSALGLILMPFLKLFTDVYIDKMPFMFLFFILNTALTYFLSYKRSILTADQKQYVINIHHYIIAISIQVLQIVVLILTKNYFLHLALTIVGTILENIFINKRVDKLYPYINDENISVLNSEKQSEIKKNVKALLMHNIASKVVNSTAGIILSSALGLVIKSFYDNYNIIFSAIRLILFQVFDGLTASIGNIHATETKEKSKKAFDQTFFMNFWVVGFSTIALFNLINSFIFLWLGEKYMLTNLTVLFLAANFYLTMIRQTAIVFRRAYGLYWADRHKAVVEAVANLLLSLILVRVMGLNGVILANILTNVFVCIWIEPLVMYKHVYKMPLLDYFKRFIPYLLVTAIALFANTFVISKFDFTYSVKHFAIKVLITAIIPNVIFLAVFFKTKEFKDVVNTIKSFFKKRQKR